jgi:hypothetical protein
MKCELEEKQDKPTGHMLRMNLVAYGERTM